MWDVGQAVSGQPRRSGKTPAMRLFVAVWPSDDVVDALRRVGRPAMDGVRWTRSEQWHVTLQFLGEVDDGTDAIAAEWQAVAAGHAPRTVHAGPATHCFGRSVLVVPVDGLDDVGRDSEGQPFTGHLTLARSRRRNLRPLAGEPFAASWRVDEITLVRSHTKPEGPVYEVIERWPFRDGGSMVASEPERG